jgi:hypothetical protein
MQLRCFWQSSGVEALGNVWRERLQESIPGRCTSAIFEVSSQQLNNRSLPLTAQLCRCSENGTGTVLAFQDVSLVHATVQGFLPNWIIRTVPRAAGTSNVALRSYAGVTVAYGDAFRESTVWDAGIAPEGPTGSSLGEGEGRALYFQFLCISRGRSRFKKKSRRGLLRGKGLSEKDGFKCKPFSNTDTGPLPCGHPTCRPELSPIEGHN